jgi:transcription elongation GreA/GreB family factor
VEDTAELRWLYVLGWAGGTELTVDGCTVMVITPSSPVGRHLIGKQVGDAFELAQAGKTREWVIEVVR